MPSLDAFLQNHPNLRPYVTPRKWRRSQREEFARLQAQNARKSSGSPKRVDGPVNGRGGVDELLVLADQLTAIGNARVDHGTVRRVMVSAGGAAPVEAEFHTIEAKSARGNAVKWWAHVPRVGLGTGSIEMVATVVVESGKGTSETFEVGPHPLVLETERLIGDVDMPAEGDTVEGDVLQVRGWFRSTIGYSHVEAMLGDHPLGRIRLMTHARPDVADFIPQDRDRMMFGIDSRLPLPTGVTGTLTLRVEAVSSERRDVIATREIEVTSRDSTKPLKPADDKRLAELRTRTETAIAAIGRRDPGSGRHALVVTHHLGLGGGQLYLQELLLKLLDEPDFRATVIAPTDGVLRKQLEKLGVTVITVGNPPTNSLDYESWLRLIIGVLPDDFDVVIANTAGTYWAMDLADRFGVPSVWAVHESFAPDVFMNLTMHPAPDKETRELFLRSFGLASAVVFEADATRILFDEFIRPGRGRRVDYGIDLDEISARRADQDLSAIRKRLEVSSSDVTLLCMGTFESRKAQALLAVAFDAIAEEFPDARLDLVGDVGGDYAEELQALVSSLPHGDRIHLHKATRHAYDWYAVADAFVLASDIESLPRSMMEAMAFGAAPIVSGVFGVPELLVEGETGMMFEPASESSAEDALRRFLSLSEDERALLATRAQDLIMSTRSSVTYAHQIRSIVDSSIADPAALPFNAIPR